MLNLQIFRNSVRTQLYSLSSFVVICKDSFKIIFIHHDGDARWNGSSVRPCVIQCNSRYCNLRFSLAVFNALTFQPFAIGSNRSGIELILSTFLFLRCSIDLYIYPIYINSMSHIILCKFFFCAHKTDDNVPQLNKRTNIFGV